MRRRGGPHAENSGLRGGADWKGNITCWGTEGGKKKENTKLCKKVNGERNTQLLLRAVGHHGGATRFRRSRELPAYGEDKNPVPEIQDPERSTLN